MSTPVFSDAVFIDTNVPIYAAGREHRLKAPCVEFLTMAAECPEAVVTDAEVLQELLHRYHGSESAEAGMQVLDSFATIMRGRVLSVHDSDVLAAGQLAREVGTRLSVRDLLHVAVMRRCGSVRIVSADRAYDALPGIERLDPLEWLRWRHTLQAGHHPPGPRRR